MMTLAILVIIAATLLSAFCSGVETGLYRVPRVRLVLDTLDGSKVARGLVWLTNHPGLYVSTLLLGNNIANYGFTIGTGWLLLGLFGVVSPGVSIGANLLTTPLIFVFCELLPKSLFHKLPHRLLKLCGWPLFLLTVVTLPVTWVLYFLSRWLQRILGEEPLRVRPALARRELRQVLREGEEAGLLVPVQRDLAQNLFAYGGAPILQYCMPLRGLRTIPMDATLTEAQQTLNRSRQSVLPVLHPRHKRLVGYFTADELQSATRMPKLRAMSSFLETASQIEVLNRLVEQKSELGRVVNAEGELVGVVLRSRLIAQMIQRNA